MGRGAALPAARRRGATSVYDQATGVAARRCLTRLLATRRRLDRSRRLPSAAGRSPRRDAARPADHARQAGARPNACVCCRRGAITTADATARPEADALVSNDARSRAGGPGRGLRAAADGRSGAVAWPPPCTRAGAAPRPGLPAQPSRRCSESSTPSRQTSSRRSVRQSGRAVTRSAPN